MGLNREKSVELRRIAGPRGIFENSPAFQCRRWRDNAQVQQAAELK
jgi:hypothetical protein